MPEAFAHRGLWSAGGPPENSIAAFDAAAAAGVGIELDIQLSQDGVPVVFHDPMLDRMTAATGAVWNHNEEELSALRLGDTEERIPTLSAVARRLPKGTPVLIELKPSPGEPDEYLRAVELALFGAGIDAAVMSFTPALNAAAKVIMPTRRRGMLVAPGVTDRRSALTKAAAHGSAYLAVRHEQVEAFASVAGLSMPLYAWTVDTEADLVPIRGAVDGIIFEHLDPTLVTG